MTEAELHNLLSKISAIAIYRISNGSQDYLTVIDAITHARTRPIIGAAQLTDTYSVEDCTHIDFAFAPDFLESNQRLTSSMFLGSLTWRFSLPNYDFGETSQIELSDGDIAISDEEGVGNWISRGMVSSNISGVVLAHCPIDDLHNAYFSYENI
jgi:hypothetical protein